MMLLLLVTSLYMIADAALMFVLAPNISIRWNQRNGVADSQRCSVWADAQSIRRRGLKCAPVSTVLHYEHRLSCRPQPLPLRGKLADIRIIVCDLPKDMEQYVWNDLQYYVLCVQKSQKIWNDLSTFIRSSQKIWSLFFRYSTIFLERYDLQTIL